MKYIRDVCLQVEAASKCVRERFREILPDDYSCDEEYDKWRLPMRSDPGFFAATGCLIKVRRRPNRYFGCASYMFDLGGDDTLATKKKEALVVVGWTGRNFDIDADCYYYGDLDMLPDKPDKHVDVFNRGVWCSEENPNPDPESQSWYYAVPLFSLHNQNDIERLLINPLIALATAPQLTESAIEQAFRDTPEIMR
jgi:hypothetical protein